MHHHDIAPDGNQGHWAVAPSSNGIDMLVQIGEINEARQARLRLPIAVALHLSGDLLAASANAAIAGTVHIGEPGSTWFIEVRAGVATVTLSDYERNADAEATLAMPANGMRRMAVEIARVATTMLEAA